jgi:hypothetical protein
MSTPAPSCTPRTCRVSLAWSKLTIVAVLIAVWGAAPGIGKSAVCAAVAQWLMEAGLKVDHFAEEEILTRPQFAEVAEYFRATGGVEPAILLAAASRFASSVLADDVDVVAADALVPFVPSLLAAGCDDDETEQFVAALTIQLGPVEATGSRQNPATWLRRSHTSNASEQ